MEKVVSLTKLGMMTIKEIGKIGGEIGHPNSKEMKIRKRKWLSG